MIVSIILKQLRFVCPNLLWARMAYNGYLVTIFGANRERLESMCRILENHEDTGHWHIGNEEQTEKGDVHIHITLVTKWSKSRVRSYFGNCHVKDFDIIENACDYADKGNLKPSKLTLICSRSCPSS